MLACEKCDRESLYVSSGSNTDKPSVSERVAADCENLAQLLNGLRLRLIAEHHARRHQSREQQLKVVSACLISAFTTLNSISSLLRGTSNQVRDALILARSFYEVGVNISFLSGDLGERSKRAEQYAVVRVFKSQKVFRRLGMSSVVFDNDRGLARSDPAVKEALDAFKSTGGNAHKAGYRESRSEMLETICNEIPIAGIFLVSVEQHIYELTSELAHGSFFGFLEVYSGGDFGNVEAWEKNAELVHFAAVLSSAAMAIAVRSTFGSCECSDEIVLAGEDFIRDLATNIESLDGSFTIRTHSE
ncbi:DUF5677 domain-containing protein [Rhodovulum sulfidophilum]|uniref:DUF5677 domain-containing protein n=1 Tax=Rhodovulum sulfidophilum TaxID=35806 RepID=UPI0015C1BA71|nr:DUF5677 domain-containing protein [Rhodovulum sulfidophilum]